MPISLICGACEAALTAPDAAAGKRVKCKKCGAILEVPVPDTSSDPDFEVIQDAPTMMLPAIHKQPVPSPAAKAPPPAAKAPPPAAKAPPPAAKAPPPPAAKPKPKPVLLEMDEDEEDDRPAPKPKLKSKPAVLEVDDDEDEDRPAPKKPGKKPAVVLDDEDEEDEPKPKKKGNGKKPAKAGGGAKMPLIIGGGVLGLAVVGFLVYWFAFREPGVTNSTPNPPNNGQPGGPPMPPGGPGPGGLPAGWQTFDAPEFSVRVPQGGQPMTDMSAKIPQVGGKKQTVSPPKVYARAESDREAGQMVVIIPLPPGQPDLSPDQLLDRTVQEFDRQMSDGKKGSTITGRATVTVGGLPGRKYIMQEGKETNYVRAALGNGRVYLLVAGGRGVNESEGFVQSFFDSFQPK